ncbi:MULTISPECIES: dTDP-4-dehydrorhamnose 3,5-epimerase [unclassified Sphingomonas]|uniref:dTDP-4-dehydrorhamnose 3,5-epimerase n=1 Tax=unclassified Sphingomonas TaxID=196159 RepID=UPI001F566680|nr:MULTISPECIES: dTDP-4-dehydrorhamnose 3,5-epimerase [unclassified Sphingomonas]
MVTIVETALSDVLILEPKVYGDDRGFFLESWNDATFKAQGLDWNFVQDNHSRSAKGVLRGLHYQQPNPQGKLVRVVSGSVFDVAVDIRKGSPTFGKWVGVHLSAANKRMVWIGPGLAHGFLSLEDDTDFLYKCTQAYSPADEHAVLWNDPEIGIEWPLDGIEPMLSAKDRVAQTLAQVAAA